MDDLKHGSEDRRGYWKPNNLIQYPDVFVWPLKLMSILKWLPKYLFPWGILYALLAFGVWTYLTPSPERMRVISIDWVAFIFLRNAALMALIVGGQHYWLYVKKAQGTSFKFNRKWPDGKHAGFTFGSQLRDNLFWTFCSGVPIWTAWEVVSLWLYANGHIAGLSLVDNPIWFFVLWFFVPLLHEFHFFWIHKMIHWPPIYKHVHKIHHRNVNPGPWSGLSMHPVEHLVYFSGFLIYWILPAHPLHFMHYSMMVGLSPVLIVR